jgi:hypothetical protein
MKKMTTLRNLRERTLSFCSLITVLVSLASVTAQADTDPYDMLVEFGLYYDYDLHPSYHPAKYAMELQRRLTFDTPVFYTQVLATHNSYNSSVYSEIAWPAAEQEIKVKDQVDIGSEFIELDIHQFSGLQYFCHNTWCTLFNNKIRSYKVLSELKDWADKQDVFNTERTVFIHIENKLSSDAAQENFVNEIINEIGLDLIYTPLDYQSEFPDGMGNSADKKTSLPTQEISRKTLRDAGKRFVIFWNGTVHGGDNIDSYDVLFSGYGGLARHWESGDNGSRDNWDDGKNIVEHYDVSATDGRFKTDGLWSWNLDEPNDLGGQDCAVLESSNGRFDDRVCGNAYAYACKKRYQGNKHVELDADGATLYPLMWSVTSSNGAWSNGESQCQALGSEWHFEVPRNMMEALALQGALQTAGEDRAWLAYTDQESEGGTEGDFVITTVDY